MFAYDAGFQIDLDAAERLIAPPGSSKAAQREQFRPKRKAPEYFRYQPAPLRIPQQCEVAPISGLPLARVAEVTLFDFGAASVVYEIPLSGPLDSLVGLADALYENQALFADSRRRVTDLVTKLGPSINRPEVSEVVESYQVFHIAELKASTQPQPGQPQAPLTDFLASHRPLLARILRAENGTLSRDEVADATQSSLSYAEDDATLVDWNAAMVFGPEADDAKTVLEFANVELLEVRHLDDRLDRHLDDAYRVMSTLRWQDLFLAGARRGSLRRIAQMQIEGALLFEGVNNALKLLGDQYLARLYRLAAERFHLGDWDASILRKLGALESIYEKLSDRQNAVRMEALEWIIVILILLEIVLPFLGIKH
jgi:hypothetical protein